MNSVEDSCILCFIEKVVIFDFLGWEKWYIIDVGLFLFFVLGVKFFVFGIFEDMGDKKLVDLFILYGIVMYLKVGVEKEIGCNWIYGIFFIFFNLFIVFVFWLYIIKFCVGGCLLLVVCNSFRLLFFVLRYVFKLY